MIKYLILSLLTMVFITASDPYFGLHFSNTVKKEEVKGEVKESYTLPYRRIKPYLEDYNQRVDDSFKINSFYYPVVQFWFLMYTHFPSSHVVIHDKSNLSIIYKVVDFSSLRADGASRESLFGVQQKITSQKVKEISANLDRLIADPFLSDEASRIIFQRLKVAGVKLSRQKNSRIELFKSMRANIRSQTGQKDFIQEGLGRSIPYRSFLYEYFHEKTLPTELLAIPFLESSFNPKAESRVSALGIWQFMPLIGSYFVPRKTIHIDYRSNVGVASVAAAFLMTENFKIMKSWDLAITAYNSGTRHLLKSKRKMGQPNATLEDIIKFSQGSGHFGFASKNFYSEFLALAHVLAYQQELFPEGLQDDSIKPDKILRFFMGKCPMRIDKVLDEDLLAEVIYYNQQLKKLDLIQPRGLIVTTKSELPANRFVEISQERMLKLKPKDWQRLINNQSCSTI